MHIFSRRRDSFRCARIVLVAAALLLPAAAGAAPFSVTYEVTGGVMGQDWFGDFVIQAGTIVVTFRNTASGAPPLHSAGVSIYYDFLGVDPGDPSNTIRLGRTLEPTSYPTGTAYRGADKSLYARRARRDDCDPYTCDDVWSFRIRANADGQILSARRFITTTTEFGPFGWFRITGQEVASTPEPGSAALMSLGAVGIAGVGTAMRWLRRRI